MCIRDSGDAGDVFLEGIAGVFGDFLNVFEEDVAVHAVEWGVRMIEQRFPIFFRTAGNINDDQVAVALLGERVQPPDDLFLAHAGFPADDDGLPAQRAGFQMFQLAQQRGAFCVQHDGDGLGLFRRALRRNPRLPLGINIITGRNANQRVAPPVGLAGFSAEDVGLAADAQVQMCIRDRGIPLASHGGGPGNVNVLCAIESAIYIETGSLKGDGEFYVHPQVLKDGALQLTDVPGMGNDVNEAYIRKYRIC